MEDTKYRIPSISEFCLEVPLYQTFQHDRSIESEVYHFISDAVNLDCYCVDCGKESVFIGESNDIGRSYNYSIRDTLVFKEFSCSRVPVHKIHFLFQIKEKKIFKIGQFPSQADFSLPDIKKYRKVLKKEDYEEFHRGVGLVTHGVGIGAVVYLRRIFEKLITDAHSKAASDENWNQEAYEKSRISEKIELLKHQLPEFLVEQKSLYGILSKGIHELSEQDCLEAFPIVKLGIELILDEEIEKKKRQEKLEAATKGISALNTKHKWVEQGSGINSVTRSELHSVIHFDVLQQMKEVPAYDVLFGVNDSSHFLHEASRRRRESISLVELFKETKPKRKWSLVNPGFLLAQSYSYFVYGQEVKALEGFSLVPFLSNIEVTYHDYDQLEGDEKSDLLKRRLRNAIAHCRYQVEIRTQDGKIAKDGDIWYAFHDDRPKGYDRIEFAISLPTFGNIIESAGEHTMNKIKAEQGGAGNA